MKKILLLLTILFVTISIISCKNPEIQSYWTDQVVTIDGDAADWIDDAIKQYEEIYTAIGLMNGADYLYIFLEFNNPFLEERIRRNGVTLWFDNTGTKKKESGIRYGADNQKIQLSDSFWEILTPEQKTKLKHQQAERQDKITFINKDNLKQHELPGSKVASGYHFERFCVEFKLPLKETFQAGNFVLKNKFSLGIEFGAFRIEGQMMPPMGFMAPPDIMTGSGRGIPADHQMSPFGKNEIWLNVSLIQKKVSF